MTQSSNSRVRLGALHHTAFRCRDAEQTRRFYEDVLGLPVASALAIESVPGSGADDPYMHIFFELGDGNFLAFFDAPGSANPNWLEQRESFDMHVAMQVPTREEMLAMQARIRSLGDPANPHRPPTMPPISRAIVRRRSRATGGSQAGWRVARRRFARRARQAPRKVSSSKARWRTRDSSIPRGTAAGLARFSTLRSWLSQWSYDDSNADGLRGAARVTVPMLVIENSADDACTPGHAARLVGAATRSTIARHMVKGASHYYHGQPEKADEAAGVLLGWMADVAQFAPRR